MQAGQVKTLGEGRWVWCGVVKGRPWNVTASINRVNAQIEWYEAPDHYAAKHHEGGGRTLSFDAFRNGDAERWRLLCPELYSVVCDYLEL